MISNPDQPPSRSPHFNSLDWIPNKLALKEADFPGQKTGDNSPYPLALDAKQAIQLYWKPRNFAIVFAQISCDYFDFIFDVPVFAEGNRPNAAGPLEAHEATTADQLAWGLGEYVKAQDIEFSTGGHGRYKVECGLQLNQAALLSQGPTVQYDIQGFATAIPLDGSDKTADVSSNRSQDDSIVTPCGAVRLLWLPNKNTGEPLGITLYRFLPGLGHYFDSVTVNIDIDLVPWDFE